ncbi:MAG: formate/nitrite transporter family protein [Tunicatimonas sp.]|uniref:formate/nitrite transporter family protein n=1 Tax=Tunicatimonas sp. TaxID=1940096 RepID=UPI003C7755F0
MDQDKTSVTESQYRTDRLDAGQEEVKDEINQQSKPKEGGLILKEQVQMALAEYRRHNRSLLLSSFSGGLEIGFSVLLMGLLYTMFYGQLTKNGLDLALAFAYPIGFIFVILGRSELFTEHTTLAVLPVLNGSVRVLELVRVWTLILVGNLIGGYVFAFIITMMAPEMGIISVEAFEYFAEKLLEFGWGLTLGSAILAGWLMGLLSWLNSSSQETTSRIFIIILVTATIGLAGLHHSIVGSIEVFAGFLISSEISFSDYLFFQLWATVGNIIGGTVFVALVKYSHLGEKSRS